MRNYERRLKEIEDEIGKDSIELELEDGSTIYVTSQDLVTGYVSTVQLVAGTISKEEVSERTLEIGKAKPGQNKMSDLIRATLKLAEDGKRGGKNEYQKTA